MPSLAKLLISLRNNAAKVGSADHYAMLGLHWSAYPQLIEEAYLREKWNVELEHYPETTSETDLESRERVSEALDQAYDMLHHPTSRRAYRETLVDKMNLESAVRLYREKGDTALMRNDPEAARDFFQRVVELAPKHRGARAKLEELGVDLS